MDVVVLACTHFPLLRSELQAAFAPGVALIDSGEAIARRVDDLIAAGGGPSNAQADGLGAAPSHVAVVTAEADADHPHRCFAALGFERVDLFDTATAGAATVA